MRLIVTQPRVLILSLRCLAAALQSMRTLHSAALAFVQMRQFRCAKARTLRKKLAEFKYPSLSKLIYLLNLLIVKIDLLILHPRRFSISSDSQIFKLYSQN